MREHDYRESRVARVLGNPTAYRIVMLLADGRKRRPTEIAREVGRSLPSTSMTLRLLRLADLVRYEASGVQVAYWMKYRTETRAIMSALRRFVRRSARRLRGD